jgi:UDP-N-acetylglucosamine--N-acetylmuramyl-(pentapeptide) pyrophosphoryl-undecaprenol N-acetylglucosamine transferase
VRLLICAGGTGGHIYPALAAVAELRQMEMSGAMSGANILWIGTRGEMEETLVPQAGLKLESIAAGPIVGIPFRKRMENALKLIWSLGQVNRVMAAFKPSVLLLTGGYVSGPVALVARARRIPVVIYLPDVEPGTAIRALIRLADRVACTTEASAAFLPPQKMVVTGYPVRPEVRAATTMSREAALEQFDLSAKRLTLFVFGGSRGARSINRALLAILPDLLAQFQVIHISGRLDWPEVERHAAGIAAGARAYYRPYPYLHQEMGAAFRAADLVVARAGASMLGECPAFALPAILVPYPYAWRYQKVNADYLAERGAAVRLDDHQLSERLLPLVLELLQNRAKAAQMRAAAAGLDRPNAARQLAHLVAGLGAGRQRARWRHQGGAEADHD